MKDVLTALRVWWNYHLSRRFFVVPIRAFRFWSLVLVVFLLFELLFLLSRAHSAQEKSWPDDARIVRAIMNEAEGETFEVKRAVADMFLNRLHAGMDLGSSGLDSACVSARLKVAPRDAWKDSWAALKVAAIVPGASKGAVYCENVLRFGVPRFIRRAGDKIQPTVKVGDIQFWKEVKK